MSGTMSLRRTPTEEKKVDGDRGSLVGRRATSSDLHPVVRQKDAVVNHFCVPREGCKGKERKGKERQYHGEQMTLQCELGRPW